MNYLNLDLLLIMVMSKINYCNYLATKILVCMIGEFCHSKSLNYKYIDLPATTEFMGKLSLLFLAYRCSKTSPLLYFVVERYNNIYCIYNPNNFIEY